MGRSLLVACLAFVSACGSAAPAATTASGSTSNASTAGGATQAAATATAAAAAAGSSTGISSADVPSGFSKCPQSGDASKSSDQYTSGEFAYQQKQGATSADAEVYADAAGSCESVTTVGNGSGKVIASVVTKFKDAASAQSAYNGGLFGAGANSVAKMTGAVSGSASGFGATSVYEFSSKVAYAMWVTGSTVVLVGGQNVAESDFKKAATALKGRTG